MGILVCAGEAPQAQNFTVSHPGFQGAGAFELSDPASSPCKSKNAQMCIYT